jgi:hypothetical protein
MRSSIRTVMTLRCPSVVSLERFVAFAPHLPVGAS